MAQSTGPIAALALITYGNSVVINNRPWDTELRIFAAAGVAAGALYLLEQVSPVAARGMAWVALVTVMFTRVNPDVPAPLESLAAWMRKE